METPTFPSLPLVDGCLLLDNSTIEKLRCPRELEYGWLRKRSLASSKAGRNFGSCMHIGWAERYQRVGTLAMPADQVEHQHDAMNKWMQENPQPEGDFRTFDHACTVMAAYNRNYGTEPFRILNSPTNGKPIVERSFMLPFAIYWRETQVISEWNGSSDPATIITSKGIPIYYIGKIDLGIEDNDGIWSFDHKTAFQFGDQFITQMKEDGGQRGYAWALGQIFNRVPTGYKIDAVRVRRPTKKQEYSGVETVDATDFMRLPFPLAPEALEEWKADTLELIHKILAYHSRAYFPRHRWQCVGKYGPCDFIEVCGSMRQFREHVLNSSLFEESTWSPLNPSGKGVE